MLVNRVSGTRMTGWDGRRKEMLRGWECCEINLLKPNDIYIYIYIYIYMYICRTAALTSRRYILNIYSTNIHTEYFKHAA